MGTDLKTFFFLSTIKRWVEINLVILSTYIRIHIHQILWIRIRIQSIRIQITDLEVQEELCRHLFIYFSPVFTSYTQFTAVAMKDQRPLTRVRKQCTTHGS